MSAPDKHLPLPRPNTAEIGEIGGVGIEAEVEAAAAAVATARGAAVAVAVAVATAAMVVAVVDGVLGGVTQQWVPRRRVEACLEPTLCPLAHLDEGKSASEMVLGSEGA